jgi:hypothetical protein
MQLALARPAKPKPLFRRQRLEERFGFLPDSVIANPANVSHPQLGDCLHQQPPKTLRDYYEALELKEIMSGRTPGPS